MSKQTKTIAECRRGDIIDVDGKHYTYMGGMKARHNPDKEYYDFDPEQVVDVLWNLDELVCW